MTQPEPEKQQQLHPAQRIADFVAPLPQKHYVRLLLVNLLIAFIWQQLFPIFGMADYWIGFVIGFFVGLLADRSYGRWIYDLAYFSGYVLWEIVVSNFRLATLVLQRNPQLDPGIIGIPLRVSTTLEIMILASVISLTPGTISVDVGKNPQGERVLYVHNLIVGNPEQFRASIQDTFERLLLRVTRGRVVVDAAA